MGCGFAMVVGDDGCGEFRLLVGMTVEKGAGSGFYGNDGNCL